VRRPQATPHTGEPLVTFDVRADGTTTRRSPTPDGGGTDTWALARCTASGPGRLVFGLRTSIFGPVNP